MMKRMLCLILAAVMSVALAACDDGAQPDATAVTDAHTEAADPTAATGGNSEPTEPLDPATGDEADPDDPDDKEGLDVKDFLRTFDRTAQIEEQVVYDADDVRVTALRMRYDPIQGAAVQFRVENGSDSDLLIQSDTCAVNGYMMKAVFNISAPSGQNADGEMIVSYPALALAGAEKIATLEFSLLLMNQSTYEVLAACDTTVIQTTAAEDYEQIYDDEGQTAYDDGNIRIVLKSVDRRRQVSEYPALVVCLYNGSDRCISILAQTLLVNGYELTPAMSTTLMPEKHAVDVVPFFDMDLREHDIDEIETVEISFRIVDDETWKTIAETDTVVLEES